MNENPIETVREYLDGGNKWMHGRAGNGDGRVCLFVAIRQALPGDRGLLRGNISNALSATALEQFPDRTADTQFPAVALNDHPDTTWDDMDLVLEKTAIQWDEAS